MCTNLTCQDHSSAHSACSVGLLNGHIYTMQQNNIVYNKPLFNTQLIANKLSPPKNLYSGPSLKGHSLERTPSLALFLGSKCRNHGRYMSCSLSPKDTSLIRTEFFGRRGVLIRRGYCIWIFFHKAYILDMMPHAQMYSFISKLIGYRILTVTVNGAAILCHYIYHPHFYKICFQ